MREIERRGEKARGKGLESSSTLPRSMVILGVSHSRDRSFPLVWPTNSFFPYRVLRHWFTFASPSIGFAEKVPWLLSHRFLWHRRHPDFIFKLQTGFPQTLPSSHISSFLSSLFISFSLFSKSTNQRALVKNTVSAKIEKFWLFIGKYSTYQWEYHSTEFK